MRCAGRTPRSGSKSKGRREACKALEENVAVLQWQRAVEEPSEQSQLSADIRRLRLQAHELTQILQAACSASGRKSSSYSSRDYGSRGCKALKRSIPCSAGLASSRTCNSQIAEGTTRPLPSPKIVSSLSSCFDSRGIRRASQGSVPGPERPVHIPVVTACIIVANPDWSEPLV